jgi:uncharacterized membrane protein YdjX (TVP38/TMEM64 family)
MPFGHLVNFLLAVVSAVVGVLSLYWTVRLAVRHGIEDARRRRSQRPAADAGWNPASRH